MSPRGRNAVTTSLSNGVTTPALAARSLSQVGSTATFDPLSSGRQGVREDAPIPPDVARSSATRSDEWRSRCTCGDWSAVRSTGECRRCNEGRKSAALRERRRNLYAEPCSYEAAHRRVRRARGRARDWYCAACGNPAEQWAYLGRSPREIKGSRIWTRDGRRRESTLAWSPDPADYSALCRLCHGRATDQRYGRGYRNDPGVRAAYLERQSNYRNGWYAALKADPARYAAYLERKRRTSRRDHQAPDIEPPQ